MRTAEDFAKWLALWDSARDRDAGIDRTARQRALRRASFGRNSDGLGTLFAALAPLDATKVENTLRQIADDLFRASGDDGTTGDQRLADALVLMSDRFAGRPESDRGTGSGGGEKPRRPTLVVICSEESLRGRVEAAGIGYTLEGNPVPASELRRLACGADILPAVMSGAGQILDFGRSRRLATDTQRLALLTMYGGCIIDGCRCAAPLIEIHHLTPYERGGRTDLAAMVPLCSRDHARSHAENWTYAHHPDGRPSITARDGTEIPTRTPRNPAVFAEPPPQHAGPRALFDVA
jgi:hypothetical protein